MSNYAKRTARRAEIHNKLCNVAEKTFDEWFIESAKPGQICLDVPAHITELSCGCTRDLEDKNFELKCLPGGWVHYAHRCGRKLKHLPQTETSLRLFSSSPRSREKHCYLGQF